MQLPPRLRIATVNCLNMALPRRRFYSGVDPYLPDEYIAKTQWLAALLDRIAADFVLVQEIFHETALRGAARRRSERQAAPRLHLAYAVAAAHRDARRLSTWLRHCRAGARRLRALFAPAAAGHRAVGSEGSSACTAERALEIAPAGICRR